MMQLAFYKGPPRTGSWLDLLEHYAIRLWTWSRYSHAELVLDGVCYGSSSRDGGVRKKVIDLTTGRWDVVEVHGSYAATALRWFAAHEGHRYDWANIVRFVLPFVPHRQKEWVCFEAIGAMLNLAATHKLTANDLYEWARSQAP